METFFDTFSNHLGPTIGQKLHRKLTVLKIDAKYKEVQSLKTP